MKKFFYSLIVLCIAASTCNAQSWKDLLNKENIEKVVNAISDNAVSVNLEGTWVYTGAAIEFESDNLLAKAGGKVAATTAEKKLNETLAKIGIKEGVTNYTFKADSTFTALLGKKTMTGTYSYDTDNKEVQMKLLRGILSSTAKVNYTSSSIDLLFDADKLLKLLTYISSRSNNTTLKAISSLSENYDGMLMGFSLQKKTE